MADACDGFGFSFVDLVRTFENNKTLDLLRGYELFLRTYKCPKCDSDLELKDNFVFRYDRQQRVRKSKKVVWWLSAADSSQQGRTRGLVVLYQHNGHHKYSYTKIYKGLKM